MLVVGLDAIISDDIEFGYFGWTLWGQRSKN
jgi:hypothetical protein